MPYVRIDPDLRLEHKGVEVFPLCDEMGCANDYWFTTDPDNCDEFYGHGNRGHFDVRMFAGKWSRTPNVAEWEEFWKARFTLENECIDALIRSAIDDGKIGRNEAVMRNAAAPSEVKPPLTQMNLRNLFEPYDGINIRPHPDGGFVVYVPYAHHEPIVIELRTHAQQIATAIEDAYHAGCAMGSIDI